MDGTIFIFLVFSGLCNLPSCSQRYHIVKDAKTWIEAQSYCRKKYTDLVTINSEEEMVRLSHRLWADGNDEFWIGLYGDSSNWKWSLEREGFYKAGEGELRPWAPNEPNLYKGDALCADISTYGRWSDALCSTERPFVCYSEFSQNRYIYVSTPMKWIDAQRYCRDRYTDLASVRNGSENKKIKELLEKFTWIGLYLLPWKWSDGQPTHMNSFKNWQAGQPDKIIGSCATTTHSKWFARNCNNNYSFVCSDDVQVQVVKVMLTKSNSSVDLEEMQGAIMQQFNQKLEDAGLGEQVRLKWIKQDDGKIFHLQENEKEKKKGGKKRKGKL